MQLFLQKKIVMTAERQKKASREYWNVEYERNIDIRLITRSNLVYDVIITRSFSSYIYITNFAYVIETVIENSTILV